MNHPNRRRITAMLRELDACQSYFQVMSTMLDNNAIIRDYHHLAVIAKSGVQRCDALLDHIDSLDSSLSGHA